MLRPAYAHPCATAQQPGGTAERQKAPNNLNETGHLRRCGVAREKRSTGDPNL